MDAQFRATSGGEPVMKENLRFLGLDVHAETIDWFEHLCSISGTDATLRTLNTLRVHASNFNPIQSA